MNSDKIEYLLKLQAKMGLRVAIDPYAAKVAGILKRPSWLHPISRVRFNKQFENRVQIVLAEHNKYFLEQLEINQK